MMHDRKRKISACSVLLLLFSYCSTVVSLNVTVVVLSCCKLLYNQAIFHSYCRKKNSFLDILYM